MAGKNTPTPVVVNIRPTCPPSVLEQIARLNRLAEKGVLRDIAWVGDTGTGIQSGFSETDNVQQRIGAVSRLLHHLNTSADESTVELSPKDLT